MPCRLLYLLHILCLIIQAGENRRCSNGAFPYLLPQVYRTSGMFSVNGIVYVKHSDLCWKRISTGSELLLRRFCLLALPARQRAGWYWQAYPALCPEQ